jgi:hypothetical protein
VVAVVAIIVAGSVGGVWATGGFNQLQYDFQAAQPGQLLDLGPWELSLDTARLTPDELDPEQTEVVLSGQCRNTTDQGLLYPSYLPNSVAIKDPSTGANASSLSLAIGGSTEAGAQTDAFNPSDRPWPCQISGVFDQPFDPAIATLQVGAMPVTTGGDLWETISASSWVPASGRPYQLEIDVIA